MIERPPRSNTAEIEPTNYIESRSSSLPNSCLHLLFMAETELKCNGRIRIAKTGHPQEVWQVSIKISVHGVIDQGAASETGRREVWRPVIFLVPKALLHKNFI